MTIHGKSRGPQRPPICCLSRDFCCVLPNAAHAAQPAVRGTRREASSCFATIVAAHASTASRQVFWRTECVGNVFVGRLNLKLSALLRGSINATAHFVESKVVPLRIRQPLWALRTFDGFRAKNTFRLGSKTQGSGLTSVRSVAPPFPILSDAPPITGCLSAYSIASNHWRLPFICLLTQRHRGTLSHHKEHAMQQRRNYPNCSRCCTLATIPNDVIGSAGLKPRSFVAPLSAGVMAQAGRYSDTAALRQHSLERSIEGGSRWRRKRSTAPDVASRSRRAV